MAHALALAARGLGQTWPNPAVGCVIVSEGRIVGRGWTQPGGRPHAETMALAQAGAKAEGATAYVTLEPCSHYGETGPCADVLLKAKIAHVVVAIQDPDPRVSGRGIDRLKAAGVMVDTGVMAVEASALQLGFLSRILNNRPIVALKIASSLDGMIATATGKSQWITGDLARTWGHRLRSVFDAILVGGGTALADDPALTVRLPGLAARSPVRIVFDRRNRLAKDAQLFRTASDVPLWLSGDARPPAEGLGLSSTATIGDLLSALAKKGITRLLVEGGGAIHGAFLKADVVDEIHWFRSPDLIGGDGKPGIAGFGVADLTQRARFRLAHRQKLGYDQLEIYHRAD